MLCQHGRLECWECARNYALKEIKPTKIDSRLVAAHERIEDLERQLAERDAEIKTARRTGNYWKMGLVEANRQLTDCKKQLAMARDALIYCKTAGMRLANVDDALASIDNSKLLDG